MTIKLSETSYRKLQGRARARTAAGKGKAASKPRRAARGNLGAQKGKSEIGGGYGYSDPLSVSFWVPGSAAPWGLCRAGRNVWTKPVCVSWQRCVYAEASTHVEANVSFAGPVALELQFHSPGRGDLTNLIKAVEDALCGRIGGKRLPGLLQDDRQVKQLRASIVDADPPGVEAAVRAIRSSDA